MRPTSLQLTDVKVALAKSERKDGPRPFSGLAYTGAVVDRLWGKAVFDLEGMEVPQTLPALLNHNASEIAGTIGGSKVDSEGLQIQGVVTDKTETGRMVIDLGRDDPDDPPFPWTLSVGLCDIKWEELREDQVAEVNGRQVEGPVSIARSCLCYEISFISAGPADKNTHAAVLRGEETTQQKEGPMDPKEFAAAHPAAVEAWKAEGRLATVKVLTALLAMFPGAAEQVVDAVIKGEGQELPAQAAMASVLYQRLQQPQAPQVAQPQPAPAVQDAPLAFGSAPQPGQHLQATSLFAFAQGDLAAQRGVQVRQGQIESLAQQAHVAPGLGFNGQARENIAQPQGQTEAQLRQLPLEERLKAEWEQDPRERSSFGGDFKAFAALRRREIAREAV